MSTTSIDTDSRTPSLRVDQVPSVPLTRLVRVELRKSFDTRAGRWFAAAIIGLVLVAVLVGAFTFPEESQTFVELLSISGGVLGYFLPVLTILLVTSEWSQRTGLATFALEPRRSRVVVAKLLAGVILAVSAMVLSAAIAAAGTLLSVADGGEAVWDLSANQLQSFLISALIGVFVGFAMAMLLRNSAAAIVVYFLYTLVLPTVVGVLSELINGFDKVGPWIEFNTAQTPLITGDYTATGQEWAQIAVSGTIWLLLPLALGIVRLVRAEVK